MVKYFKIINRIIKSTCRQFKDQLKQNQIRAQRKNRDDIKSKYKIIIK